MGYEEEIPAEEVSIPAESDIQPDDQAADEQPDNAGDDFETLFDKASESAARKPDSDDVEPNADETPDDEPGADEESTEDEQTEESEKKDGETAEPEKETEKSEKPSDEKPGDEKPSRVSKFKQLEEENARLLERQQSLDKTFEKYGGTEAVADMAEFFEKAMNPQNAEQFAEELQNLPHGQRIERAIFDRHLEMPENRVYAVNSVLRDDFGLEKTFSVETLEKIFQVITGKASEDAEDFENFLDRELSYLPSSEESEVERLKRENELLKNPPKQEDQAADKAQMRDLSNPAVQVEIGIEAGNKVVDYQTQSVREIAMPMLKEYGFEALAPLAEIFIPAAIHEQELKAIAEAKAGGKEIPLLPRMSLGEMFISEIAYGKDAENTVFAKGVRRAYEKVVKAKTQEFIKMISGAIKPAKSATTDTETDTEPTPKTVRDSTAKPRAALAGAATPSASITPGRREKAKSDVWDEDWT